MRGSSAGVRYDGGDTRDSVIMDTLQDQIPEQIIERARREKLWDRLFGANADVPQTTLDAIKAATISRAKRGDTESKELIKDYPDFFGEQP